ncbi:MAG: FMN-binding protein [Planctomycetota bacterium]|nr:FMN-binding protein [Planctomycetota bacterium]
MRNAAWLLALCAASALAQSAEPAPLQATLYLSQDDPRATRAREAVQAAARPFGARIDLVEVGIDDLEGYKRLKAAERDLEIAEPGEVTLTVGRFALTSKGARRDVEDLAEAVFARLLGGDEHKKRRAPDVAAFAQAAFGSKDAQVAQDHQDGADTYYEVRSGGARIGWVVDVYRRLACPVCSDAQFLIAVKNAPLPEIVSVKPVRELERYGKPLDADAERGFLAAFKGRTEKDAQPVDGVSGATKTSRAYMQGAAEALKGVRRGDGK